MDLDHILRFVEFAILNGLICGVVLLEETYEEYSGIYLCCISEQSVLDLNIAADFFMERMNTSQIYWILSVDLIGTGHYFRVVVWNFKRTKNLFMKCNGIHVY